MPGQKNYPIPKKINYADLPTEQVNQHTRNLDQLPIDAILRTINREDCSVPIAVAKAIAAITQAVGMIVASLERGGKLYLVGAGTSGRLAVMEAAECPPTFHTDPALIQAIMAGGRNAVFQSIEGAEDRGIEAKKAIGKRVTRRDVVVGIAASGVTPFVAEALQEAKQRKAKTILITCNPKPLFRSFADIVIAPFTGPEVISGSTRLKAGTATKLILNMLTVASMVKLGKVYENRMVDLMPRSKKLEERALRLIEEIGRVPRSRAQTYFKRSGHRAKLAIIMARKKMNKSQALKLLKKSRGFLRKALDHAT